MSVVLIAYDDCGAYAEFFQSIGCMTDEQVAAVKVWIAAKQKETERIRGRMEKLNWKPRPRFVQ